MVENSRLIARRIRVLESEILMLKNYLVECQDLFSEYELEYNKDISYFVELFSSLKSAKENPDERKSKKIIEEVSELDPRVTKEKEQPPEEKQPSSQKPVAEKEKHPSWVKSIYRKIAMITHPDKVKDDERKARLEQQFQEASKAIEDCDYNSLITLALSLNLKTDLGSAELIPVYKQQITDIKEEIKGIESSVPWLWGEGLGMMNVRAKILRSVLKSHSIDTESLSIEEEIKKREKQLE